MSEQSYWDIEVRDGLTPEARKHHWETVHTTQDYETVVSVTEDPAVLDLLAAELPVQRMGRIWIPGSGSRVALQRHLLEMKGSRASLTCSDFPAVIAIARDRLQDPRLEYVGCNTTEFVATEPFDAVLVVNSILSDDHTENRDMLMRCKQALEPKRGRLVGLFPTIFAALDISYIAADDERLRTVDVWTSSKFEPGQRVRQIFYTPLRLRHLLRSVGLRLERMQIVFLEQTGQRNRAVAWNELTHDDPDLLVYELLVVATPMVE